MLLAISFEEAIDTIGMSGGFIPAIIGMALILCVIRCLAIIISDSDMGKGLFHFTKASFYGMVLYFIYNLYKTVSPKEISILMFIITIFASFGFSESVVKVIQSIKELINVFKRKK